MDMIINKLLLVANKEVKAIISNSLDGLSGVEILEADSENKTFELIYNHFFFLVIVDESLPHFDIYKIGAMLLSHKDTHNAPLLIITDNINPGNLFTDFKTLQIDYIVKPFDEQLIRAKIIIFLELFKLKNAVDQSIEELDHVYKKVLAQHERVMEEAFLKKLLINSSTIAANQMQQPLRNLQGSLYQLLRNRDMPQKTRSNLASIKTAADRISHVTKKLFTFPGISKKIHITSARDKGLDRINKVLYIEDSDEDFKIFKHVMKSVLRCELTQAETIEQGVAFTAGDKFDLVFTGDLLPDGTGLDLLSRFNRMRLDIPVIFILDRPHIHKGPEAISKGAYNYFMKEEISSSNIHSIIFGTLQKVKITQEVEDARNRIVMISRRDTLTRLYNRQSFERGLTLEISKAKRYNIGLSIFIVGFDNFKTVNETLGHDTSDAVLATSAALIQSMVRDNDLVSRYSQEKFAIALPHTGLNGAGVLAQRISEKISNHEFKKDANVVKLSVSIGIASYTPNTDTTAFVLIKRALDALASARNPDNESIRPLIP